MKRPDESLASFAQALALKPDFDYLKGAHLHAKMHVCDWTDLEPALRSGGGGRGRRCGGRVAVPAVRDPGRSGMPASMRPALPRRSIQDDRADLARRALCASAHSRGLSVGRPSRPPGRAPDRRDCSSAMTGRASRRLAISFKSDTHNRVRERLSASFERFVDAERMGDAEIARLMRELEIDIAVDLNGYTEGSRPAVLAQRPAPVQVNYLGFAGTLGQPCLGLHHRRSVRHSRRSTRRTMRRRSSICPIRSWRTTPAGRSRPHADAGGGRAAGRRLGLLLLQQQLQDHARYIRRLDAAAQGDRGQRAVAVGGQCQRGGAICGGRRSSAASPATGWCSRRGCR